MSFSSTFLQKMPHMCRILWLKRLNYGLSLDHVIMIPGATFSNMFNLNPGMDKYLNPS